MSFPETCNGLVNQAAVTAGASVTYPLPLQCGGNLHAVRSGGSDVEVRVTHTH